MNKEMRDLPRPQGLYDPSYEHDACGIGIVANIKGKKSYGIIDDALTIWKTSVTAVPKGLTPTVATAPASWSRFHTSSSSANVKSWAFPFPTKANTASA